MRQLIEYFAANQPAEAGIAKLRRWRRTLCIQGEIMPTIETCGPEGVRTTFTYRGNVTDGVTIEFDNGDFSIDADVMQNVRNHFRGRSVRGGFSMTEPTPGGVGEYLAGLGGSLTPRHASFLCAILRNEGFVTCDLDGNAVVMTFNA